MFLNKLFQLGVVGTCDFIFRRKDFLNLLSIYFTIAIADIVL